MSIVVPAVLPSSREDLEKKLALFAGINSVHRIQIDVVDGTFATPASWPYTTPGELQKMVQKGEMLPRLGSIEYEIDLMCLDAEHAVSAWLALGATRLIFHAETVNDLPRLLAAARRRYGAGADFAPGLISFGLALNITSDLALVEMCLNEIDFVQFMGIAQIGRQGQPFDERVLEKVRVFRHRHPDTSIQVDGGISLSAAKKLIAAGVTNLVIGSGILKAKNPATALAAFEALEVPYGV